MLTEELAHRTLRVRGMRITPQRRAVIAVLAGNASHPTAEMVASSVAAALPGVSLTTVYNTLHELAAVGLLKELGLPGSMRFDAEIEPHAHLVCARCGSVVDVEVSRTLSDFFSAPTGATIDRIDVTLHGSCESCEAT